MPDGRDSSHARGNNQYSTLVACLLRPGRHFPSADLRQQYCRPSSAILLTYVGNTADVGRQIENGNYPTENLHAPKESRNFAADRQARL
jgi:hypothetical protein